MKTPSSDTGDSQSLNFPPRLIHLRADGKTAIVIGWYLHICYLHFSLYTFPNRFPQPLQVLVFAHVP